MRKLLLALLLSPLFISSTEHITDKGGIVLPQVPKTSYKPLSTSVSPVELAVAVEEPKPSVTAVSAPAPYSGACGDNEYAHYIYMHESSCTPGRVNSIGCIGIGQSCSPAIFRATCPNLDYACENQFFTNYMLGRYGTWEKAYNFWVANRWW